MNKYLAIGTTALFLIAFFVFPYISYNDMSLFSSILFILQNGEGGLLGVIVYGLAFMLAVIGLVMIFTHKENKFTRYAGILASVAALIDLSAVGIDNGLEFGFWIILISAIGMAISDYFKPDYFKQ